MPDNQIIAIYHRLVESKDPELGKPKPDPIDIRCEQLSFLPW